jgi:hypothetical protein
LGVLQEEHLDLVAHRADGVADAEALRLLAARAGRPQREALERAAAIAPRGALAVRAAARGTGGGAGPPGIGLRGMGQAHLQRAGIGAAARPRSAPPAPPARWPPSLRRPPADRRPTAPFAVQVARNRR